MDNHPIPQDVTSFQFRLIGDMTIKQFGYIVGGVIFAWVMLATPLFLLLRLVLAGIWVLVAVTLAFLPIDGRPADMMLLYFLKAVINPTQFVYRKTTDTESTSADTKTIVATVPKSITQQPKIKTDEKVQVEAFTPAASAAVATKAETDSEESKAAVQPLQTTPAAQIQQEQKLQKEVADLSLQLQEAKAEETKQHDAVGETAAHEKVSSLEEELQEIMQQKAELEKQLVMLQKSLTEKKQQVFTPSAALQPQETQHVRKLPKSASIAAGAPLMPDVPNLISGIIKDPRGNVLANILIEVKDKDGNPVRAFKTNQLGQFAAATPLVNGTYTISFEDPAGKQSFDSVEISAAGEILSPFEIISVDAREKLRQELFGAQT